MLGTHKIIVDQWAEIWDLLEIYADDSFWQWPAEPDPEAVYIIGRVVLKQNWQDITDWATRHPGQVIFSNPAEGSETILLQLKRLRITELVMDRRIGLLTSGDLGIDVPYCQTDCYFSNIVEYTENQTAQLQAATHIDFYRPYEFLFLNGRLRPHRKYLIDRLRATGALDQALWTNLGSKVEMAFTSKLKTDEFEPIRLLPPEYEIDRARTNLQPSLYAYGGFIKHQLFNNTWGDAIVNPLCYTDTWFSLVTETIFDYPYTFRTEKIWKPILMAHPFIVAANKGYYRDLRHAGFKTFHSLIDESFDLIDSPADRIDRVADLVTDLAHHGAAEFWKASRDICKYNQQHLLHYNRNQRAKLPQQLLSYIDQHL